MHLNLDQFGKYTEGKVDRFRRSILPKCIEMAPVSVQLWFASKKKRRNKHKKEKKIQKEENKNKKKKKCIEMVGRPLPS